jgi:hypothetical protein
MAARDIFHEQVKQALIKDGWMITADPLTIPFGNTEVYVDLGAEKLIAAEKGNQRIAVEIKSFLHPSVVNEFHTALGQFLNYRAALIPFDPERQLYLAMPNDTYSTFFAQPFLQGILQQYHVETLVYDPFLEEVVQWIHW